MKVLAGLADLLWPPRCVACDAGSVEPLCPDCAVALVPTPEEQRLSFPRPPAWTTAECRYEYGGPLATAILRAKYGREGATARLLGRLLRPLPAFDLAVPVPLHPRRFRSRGFNQATELLRGAGAHPTLGLLHRIRHTAPQGDAPPPARWAHVRSAFAVRGRAAGRILLVDDVMTTGATADECARTLLAAGAAEVHVLALARAPV